MFKHIFLSLAVSILGFAQMKTFMVTPEIINSGVKVIDIRTEAEWKQTGIIKDSILLTFYDEKGNYDPKKFLTEVEALVKKGEKVAIICRSGSRSVPVANYLGKQGYESINLKGGIISLKNQGYELVEYEK